MSSPTGSRKHKARKIVLLVVAISFFLLGWSLRPERDWFLKATHEQIVFQVMPEWAPTAEEVEAELQRQANVEGFMRRLKARLQHPCTDSCTPENCHRKKRERERKEFLEKRDTK